MRDHEGDDPAQPEADARDDGRALPRARGARGRVRLTDAKQAFRERIWALLEREALTRFPGARGRIPNFKGAEAAADRLASLPEWKRARVLKTNPDSPQLPVRRRALAEKKVVYMAVPRLAAEKPFVRLHREATIKGALRDGRPTAIEEMERIDLVVCGSVAVNRKGARVGKGGGYSDLELALLVEAGLIDGDTLVATTVHELQVLDEDLPETEHDFRVDRIVTPAEVVVVEAPKRRAGVLWDHLDEEQIGSIPVLASASRPSGPPPAGRGP